MPHIVPVSRDHPLRVWRNRQKPPQTLGHFAQLVGASKATISRIESEQQAPSAGLIRKIVEATGGAVSAEALIGRCTRQRQKELSTAEA